MSLRSWATPLVIGAFLVMSVSGSLMFFHLNTGTMKLIHEWAGLVMVAGGIAHLILNWRAFTCYFKRPMASAIMGLGAIALGFSLVPGLGPQGGPGGMRAVIGAMGNARIETLAELSGQTPEALIAALADKGYPGARVGQTVKALAAGDTDAEHAILEGAFDAP